MIYIHRVLRIFPSIFLLVGICLTSCEVGAMFPYESEMRKGNESYLDGRYKQAEAHYLKALQIARENKNLTHTLVTLGDLGRTYSVQEKNAEAEEIFRQRVELIAGNQGDEFQRLDAYAELTSFYLLKNRCAEAQENFTYLRELYNSSAKTEYSVSSKDKVIALFQYKDCEIP